MRVGHVLQSRLNWYDRAPATVHNVYSANAAPHASTTRWTYTVPAGKKAYLEGGQAAVIRYSAAGPADQSNAALRYQPAGGSASPLYSALIVDNTVGAKDVVTVGSTILLYAGDALLGVTSDLSTGGLILYRTIGKLSEFDA